MEFARGAWGVGRLLIQRLTVAKAASEELRPVGDRRDGVGVLGEEFPEIGMVPAEVVAGGVAMFADAGAQAANFREEFVACHGFEIGVAGCAHEETVC